MFGMLYKKIAKLVGVPEPIDTEEMLRREKVLVDNQYKEYFDERFHEYLDKDYSSFLKIKYPKQVKNYDFVDEKNYPATSRPEYALSLSGGGIRSASFAIGVIQALANQYFFKGKPSIFSKFKYLSTVSGGGYAGAALSWFMRIYQTFPFGNLEKTTGSKNTHNDSSKILAHIRQHGKYLSPPELGLYGLIGFVAFSTLHSLLAYTLLTSISILFLFNFIGSSFVSDLLSIQLEFMPFLDLTMSKVHSMAEFFRDESDIDGAVFSPLRHNFLLFFLDMLFLVIGLFFVSMLVLGLSSYFSNFYSGAYGYRVLAQKWLAFLLKALCFVFILALLPMLVSVLVGAQMQYTDKGSVGALGSGLGGIVYAVLKFRKQSGGTDNPDSPFASLGNLLLLCLIIVFLLSLSFSLAEVVYGWSMLAEINRPIAIHPNWLVFFAFALVLFVNINQISLHKMYRDRLMDTFLKDPKMDSQVPLSKRGKKANTSYLQGLKDGNGWAPYHLVNCNVILANSNTPRYQGRLGDAFLLSSLYCGSDATKYSKTEDFSLGKMTLATAMSISGAAVNPHAGVAGSGLTVNPITSTLLTVLGLRLGYWVHNPRSWLARIKPIMKPNYFFPGVFSLLNFGHKESSVYIEVSDGGHFDNSGLYELIRRRVPVIFFSDGSEDADTKFEDLGNAIERVRVDFGVSIRFTDEKLDLSGLIPGSQEVSEGEGAAKIYDRRYSLSERGYAMGDIVYPEADDAPAFIGKLVYIKASMTRNLPGDIYAYKSNFPSFPNQPTTDQFFDEKQFEAYRELGYQLTKQFIHDKYAMEQLP